VHLFLSDPQKSRADGRVGKKNWAGEFVQSAAIIFDLGGVILNLDFALTRRAFGVIRKTECGRDEGSLPFFLAFERGLIGEAEFRDELCKLLGVDLKDAVLDRAWNAMLLDLPPARLELLAQLAKSRRIFLLSNTNSIHKRAFDEILDEAGLTTRFHAPFEKLHFSHEIGMRKPDPEIYSFVLEQNNLDASATIFVDDLKINVDQASALGIRGIHLVGKTILDLEFE
jgi:putative hydrolase of the HAD superfamily